MSVHTVQTKSGGLYFINTDNILGNKIVVENDTLGHFIFLTEADKGEILAATGAEEFILKETPHVEPLSQEAGNDDAAGNADDSLQDG
jgi:hypothetical protein